MAAIAQQLEQIVDSASICPWAEIESGQQQQVVRSLKPGVSVDCVVYPNTQAELSEVMAAAHKNHWRVLPCGQGTKLDWGGLATEVNLVLSTARLNKVINHAIGDLTVTAEAGIRFHDLQAQLAQERQFLALDPAYTRSATLGGIVATADTGALRQRYGGVRDMLIGISFVRADGQVAKAGGQVVKNVAGYDLMKLMTGSYGSLSILTQLTFRTYAVAETSQTVLMTGSAEAIAQAAAQLRASVLTPWAMDILSPYLLTQMPSLQIETQQFGLATQFQSVPAGVEAQVAQCQAIAQGLSLNPTVLKEAAEAQLWQQIPAVLYPETERVALPPNSPPDGGSDEPFDRPVLCKIGILPADAVDVLHALQQLIPEGTAFGRVHASSGVGMLQLNGTVSAEQIEKMRQLCQSHGGYLTVLQAPVELKQQIEVWGYTGNALDLMGRLKHQFDENQLLSPGRFVGQG